MTLCVMLGYNGLELVVYGAVELGDVVLTFVGIHGLTGHLWHGVSPLLCFNSSTEQGRVNVGVSVMTVVRLHLTENFSSGRSACK